MQAVSACLAACPPRCSAPYGSTSSFPSLQAAPALQPRPASPSKRAQPLVARVVDIDVEAHQVGAGPAGSWHVWPWCLRHGCLQAGGTQATRRGNIKQSLASHPTCRLQADLLKADQLQHADAQQPLAAEPAS